MALPIWGKFFGKLAKDKDSAYNKLQDAKFAKLDTSKRTIITDCSKYKGWGADLSSGKTDLTQIIQTETPTDLMENKYDNLDEEDPENMNAEEKPKAPIPDKKPETSPAALDDKKPNNKKSETK
jgi:hypothetical protein